MLPHMTPSRLDSSGYAMTGRAIALPGDACSPVSPPNTKFPRRTIHCGGGDGLLGPVAGSNPPRLRYSCWHVCRERRGLQAPDSGASSEDECCTTVCVRVAVGIAETRWCTVWPANHLSFPRSGPCLRCATNQ